MGSQSCGRLVPWKQRPGRLSTCLRLGCISTETYGWNPPRARPVNRRASERRRFVTFVNPAVSLAVLP